MFKIITTGWNCEKYADGCINSVLNQTVENWQMFITLDPCDDNTFDICNKYKSDKIIVKQNQERMYSPYNIYNTIKNLKINYEDILIFLDLDDQLKHNRVIQVIQDFYNCIPELLITYGNYEHSNGIKSYQKGYCEEDFKIGIRNTLLTNWQASHLKTMKYKLFRLIKKKSFKHSNGTWLKHATDMIFMIAGLEMTGYNRSRFIDEVLYIYNIDNENLNQKINQKNLDDCCNEVYRENPYKLIRSKKCLMS